MGLKHSNPARPRRDKEGNSYWARAPYNFIPLPETVVLASDDLPGHDQYHDEKLTGHIECELVTCSPTYIRGVLTPSEYKEFGVKRSEDLSDIEKQQCAGFFSVDPNRQKPVIPGSSLRGMIRNIMEIITFSRMRWVGKEPTFTFRAVAAPYNDPLREPYREVVGELGKNVRAGYLVRRGDDWFIKPASTPSDIGLPGNVFFLKVKENNIDSHALPEFIRLDNPNYRPQLHEIRFNVQVKRSASGSLLHVSDVSNRDKSNAQYEGWLVCSGNMKETANRRLNIPTRRSSHTIILMPKEGASEIKICEQAIKDYQSGLTPFQKEMLQDWSKDCMTMGCLEDSKPVFYVLEGKEVAYFGHSPNFRIPARLNGSTRAAIPPDFIPSSIQHGTDPDMTDALFGWIEDEVGPKKQFAGRVSFSDATMASDRQDVWLKDSPLTPHTLSNPKATTFQHYLVQDINQGHDPDNKTTLAHYGSTTGTTQLRGYKLYWHRGDRPNIEATAEELDHKNQLTQIRPIQSGVRFNFTIFFENLIPDELGALWWALTLPGDPGKNYCHRIGMGKPLGMGSVKLTPNLIISNRRKEKGRYSRLFSDRSWYLSEHCEKEIDYANFFEKDILKKINAEGKNRLAHIPRIKMLLVMLEWQRGTKEWMDATSYMKLETGKAQINEYKERPVLPDPLAVVDMISKGIMNFRSGNSEVDVTDSVKNNNYELRKRKQGMEITGRVRRWVQEKSYGFITPDDGGKDIFVHISDVIGAKALNIDDHVSFILDHGPKGIRAKRVNKLTTPD